MCQLVPFLPNASNSYITGLVLSLSLAPCSPETEHVLTGERNDKAKITPADAPFTKGAAIQHGHREGLPQLGSAFHSVS